MALHLTKINAKDTEFGADASELLIVACGI